MGWRLVEIDVDILFADGDFVEVEFLRPQAEFTDGDPLIIGLGRFAVTHLENYVHAKRRR